MNPPTYSDLLKAATPLVIRCIELVPFKKGGWEVWLTVSDKPPQLIGFFPKHEDAELFIRERNAGPAVVEALRYIAAFKTTQEMEMLTMDIDPSDFNINACILKARAVLAALDGKDA